VLRRTTSGWDRIGRRIVVLVCCLLAACGGGDGEERLPTPTQPPTTTAPAPPTTLSQEEADEAALRQLTQDWYEYRQGLFAGASDIELIGEYATDDYASAVRSRLDDFLASGDSIEIGDRTREVVEEVRVDSGDAEIDVCFFSDDRRLSAGGEVVNDTRGTSRSTLAAARTNAAWRLTGQELISEEEGDTCP
jgi:hypothetical protein